MIFGSRLQAEPRLHFPKNAAGDAEHGFRFLPFGCVRRPWVAQLPSVVGKDVRLFEQRGQPPVDRLAVRAQFLQVVRPPKSTPMPREESLKALLGGLLAKKERAGEMVGTDQDMGLGEVLRGLAAPFERLPGARLTGLHTAASLRARP